MADRPILPPRPDRPWRHDWFSYEQYQVVHYRHMEGLLAEGLVVRDGLAFVEFEDDRGEMVAVTLRGRLVCHGDVVIRIDNKMMVRRGAGNRLEVRTRYFQYHAWRRQATGRPRRDIIRYDNAHAESLHVHLFDESGAETELRPLTLDEMPTLDAFVRFATRTNPTG